MDTKQILFPEIEQANPQADRIYQIHYEDLSTQIYYGANNAFSLAILKNEKELLLHRPLSRAQAFRIMNTPRSMAV